MMLHKLVLLLGSFFIILSCCSCAPKKKSKGYIHPLGDESYETMLLLLQGNFNVPVAERTREQKNAVVRFWRNRDRFHLGPQSTPTLYCDGKKVVKKSKVSTLVDKTFKEAKAGGCKKLRCRAADGYVGLSERRILQVTNSEVKYRIHNARFTNKAIPKPVTAKNIQSQHQVDLIDFSKDGAVKYNGRTYKYILSVMDIFSRYLWLRPLERKSSKHVAKSMTSIFAEHGPPDRLQSDRGTEFRGHLRSVCKKWKIKMIRSRPYHPQSQGKVERSHKRLRKKIMYDMVTLGEKGVNWVAQLTNYNRILNEEVKEELGWKTPFEVYYGRKSDVLLKTHIDKEESDDALVPLNPPRRQDFQRYFRNIKKLRKVARVSSKKQNERMINRRKRMNQAQQYKCKEQVLIRVLGKKRRGSIMPKKRFVLRGTIVKKSRMTDMYKVRFIPPNENKEVEKWVSVEDITSLTSNGQHKDKRDKIKRIKEFRKKMKIPLEASERFLDRDFADMDLTLIYDPPGNGNCQFDALRFWLEQIGIYRSAAAIRQEIVRYLEEHPNDAEGFPLELFVGVPWLEYLQDMAKDGTYGDHLTLQAAADLYSIQIIVYSSLGADETIVILPTHSLPLATVQLGHYAENHGEHYICVERPNPAAEEQQALSDDSDHSQIQGDVMLDEPRDNVGNAELSGNHSSTNQTSIHFVPDDATAFITMRLSKDDQSKNTNTATIETLPDKILEKILMLALCSSGCSWPNHICEVFNVIHNVNTRFRYIVKRFITTMLPRVHISHDGQVGIVSVRKIINQFGKGSGLTQEIKRILAHPKWANTWLKLYFIGQGWFAVVYVYWKHR